MLHATSNTVEHHTVNDYPFTFSNCASMQSEPGTHNGMENEVFLAASVPGRNQRLFLSLFDHF